MRKLSAITTNILQPNGASNLQAQLFRYDSLNRLKQSVTVDAKQKMLHNGPLSWNNSTTNTLSSTYSYDAGDKGEIKVEPNTSVKFGG